MPLWLKVLTVWTSDFIASYTKHLRAQRDIILLIIAYSLGQLASEIRPLDVKAFTALSYFLG